MAAYDFGFALVYAANSRLSWEEVVSVTETATRSALQDATLETTPRLLGEVLQEQRVHRSLEANVKLADLAFGERHDLHSGKAHAFEEAGGVLLVAADPIECLRVNEIELAPWFASCKSD